MSTLPVDTASAVKDIVTALYLYPNYRVDSRGPYGCLLDAIRKLAPKVAEEVVENGAHETYQRHYAEEGKIMASEVVDQQLEVTRAIANAEKALDIAIDAWRGVMKAETVIAENKDALPSERAIAQRGVGSAVRTISVLMALRGK